MELNYKEDLIWLSISLFSDRDEWAELLGNGIVPFITSEEAIHAFLIQFSYLGGENIRLSILVYEMEAPNIASLTDKYFKEYFSIPILESDYSFATLTSIFRQFPKRSIQYGLYPPVRIKAQQCKDYCFRVELSSIIIDGFKGDEIDDNNIITFGFYLQMGLIMLIKQIPISIDEGLNFAIKRETMSQEKFNRDNFNESRDVLIEIANDIFQGGAIANLPWFRRWIKLCSTEIQDYRRGENKGDIYHNIVSIVYTHLGVSPEISSILSFFTTEVIKSIEI